MVVRTRIAPSPTGNDIHIGNLYTAYMNWAFARKHNGQFVIRIEDTDRTRFVEGAEKKILQSLRSYGIDADESPEKGGPYEPYRQSDRLPIYQKYAKELLEKGHAYYCFCTAERLEQVREQMKKEKKIPKYDRYCLHNVKDAEERVKKGETYVIRLKVPDNYEIKFNDLIRGEIVFNSDTLDDQVLLKSDGFPTYHLAVVVDDYLMKISHVVRAEEWISSTPKHVLLYQAFGWELPIFAHMPILRNTDRSKLSKRRNAVWASAYLEQGFLPEAMLNFLALMGWSHPDGKEIFDKDEFIKHIDLKDISPVGPAFDPVKLEWMNGEYIRSLKPEVLAEKIYTFYNKTYPKELIEKTTPLIQERIKKLSDYFPITEFFFTTPTSCEVDLSSKKDILGKIKLALSTIGEWKAATIGEVMLETAKNNNVKNSEFFMILRVAITGKKISPPLNESMELLGKDECINRIQKLL